MNIKEAIRKAVEYMASRSNPAEVKAAQFNGMTTSEIQTLFANNVNDGTFAFSKFGDNSWMPANILGSFEGGQRAESYPYTALLREADGTYAFLENATNGSKQSVYYTFVEEGIDKKITLNPTPRRYEPAILKRYPNHRVYAVFNSEGRDVVWGQLLNEDTLTTRNFIGLTNGTLDASKHVCTDLVNMNGVGASWRMIRVKDKIYAIGPDYFTTVVKSCNVSDILAGNPITFTNVTGWTTTGIKKTFENLANIQIADGSVSTDPDADSILFRSSNVSNVGGQGVRQWMAVHETDNKIRMIWQVTYQVYDRRGGSMMVYATFVVDIDFDAKTAVTAPGCRYNIKMADVGDDFIKWAPGSEQIGITAKYGVPRQQLHDQVFVSDDGRCFYIHWANEGLGVWSTGYCGSSFEKTLWDKFAFDTYSLSDVREGTLYRRFGSYVGGNIFMRSPFPDGKIILYSTASDMNTGLPRNIEVIVTPDGPADEFTYKTDFGGIKGYEPTTDRIPLQLPDSRVYYPWCSVMSGKDKKILKVAGTSLSPERNVLTTAVDLITLPDGKVSSSNDKFYTLPADGLDAAKAKALNDTLSSFPNTTGIQYYSELWIPPKGKRSYPPLVYIQVWHPHSQISTLVIYNCSITWASGDDEGGVIGTVNILGGPVITPFLATGVLGISGSASLPTGFVYEHCDVNDNLLYSLLTPPSVMSIHNGFRRYPSLGLLPGDNAYTSNYTRIFGANAWYFGNSAEYMVDGVGMVLFNQDLIRRAGGATWYYRKMKVGDTLAETWPFVISNTDTANRILVSSQVAEGYNLYFTDDEPAIIKGFYFTLGKITIDLRTISSTPANKTFYVYLDETNGVVSYVISLQQDEDHPLYIGWVKTDDTQISQINIVKATKFNW